MAVRNLPDRSNKLADASRPSFIVVDKPSAGRCLNFRVRGFEVTLGGVPRIGSEIVPLDALDD
jgi:hypothetical protein